MDVAKIYSIFILNEYKSYIDSADKNYIHK